MTLLLAGCESCADRPLRPGNGARDGGGDAEDDQDSGAGDGYPNKDATGSFDSGDFDSGSIDVGSLTDAGFFFDASNSNSDSGVWPDAFVAPDAFAPDAFAPDAFAPDAFAPDAVVPGNGDIWVEIDYSAASSPRSPAFRFSNTPGWGGAQWAAVNASWPEAWDRWNNMAVVNDPIGRSLEIGPSSELQLMIGLEELIGYTSATVRIEGRSRSTSASAAFDVYNPWNGCGVSTTIRHDWQVHVVELDLAQCFEIGQGVQAVRVEPTGTLALVRLRLTLHGAVY